MGGGRREGGRWDAQQGRSWEKQEINFVTLHNFCNRKSTQRLEPLRKGGEPAVQSQEVGNSE